MGPSVTPHGTEGLRVPMIPAVAGLLVAVAGAYAACTAAPYFWDDFVLILDNRVILEERVGEAILGNLWGDILPSPYHRPLVVLTFCLDHRLWGIGSPGPWHLHSLLWHLLTIVAVAWCATPRLGPSRALVASAIFALHPIHSEAVMWLSARNDLMCMAFLATTLGLLDRHADAPRVRTLVAIALTALAACMSKELGYALPLLWVAWRRAFGLSVPLRPLGAVLAGLAVGGLLRAQADLQSMPIVESAAGMPVPMWRPPLAALGWVSWPWPLTSASVALTAVTTAEIVSAIVTVGGLAVLVTRRPSLGWLVASAALLWSPTLLVYHYTGLIGERYLYAPLAFLAIAVVAAWPDRRATHGLALAAVAGLLALGALGVRLADWRSPVALVESAALRVPNSYTLSWYAAELARAGDASKAADVLERAVRMRPLRPTACTQVPEALLRAGEPDATLQLLKRFRGTPCEEMPGVRLSRIHALWAVGRVGEAWGALMRWRGPAPRGVAPLNMALCMNLHDLDCAAAVLVQWEAGAADLLSSVEDLRAATASRSARGPAATP